MSEWEETIRKINESMFEIDQYFCPWCGSDHGNKIFPSYGAAEEWLAKEGFQKRICEECQLSVGP